MHEHGTWHHVLDTTLDEISTKMTIVLLENGRVPRLATVKDSLRRSCDYCQNWICGHIIQMTFSLALKLFSSCQVNEGH